MKTGSKQFAVVLPKEIADVIDREATRNLTSGASIVRQIIAESLNDGSQKIAFSKRLTGSSSTSTEGQS